MADLGSSSMEEEKGELNEDNNNNNNDNHEGIQIDFQSSANSSSQSIPILSNDYNFSKPIPASHLREHIQQLLDAKDPNFPEINGFDVEFNYIETQTAQEQYSGDFKSAVLTYNKNKNRYSNVLPPEKTRVKLKVEEGEEGSDYINANFISGLIPSSERAYIATQGPLQSSFGDFWRMVWQVDAVVIIMLTKEVENGKLKCDRYWPDYDCPLTCYPFKVTLETQDDSNPELATRKFILHNIVTEESREIFQFQYIAWPDHGLPVSTTAFLDLAHKADTANTSNGPIIVHCSAGIGRSGTFCTVHSIIEKLRLDTNEKTEKEPEFNIVKTVLFMREQRPGMVQTKEQYMFCYLTLLEECERLFHSKQSAHSIAAEIFLEAKEEDDEEQDEEEENENGNGKEEKKKTSSDHHHHSKKKKDIEQEEAPKISFEKENHTMMNGKEENKTKSRSNSTSSSSSNSVDSSSSTSNSNNSDHSNSNNIKKENHINVESSHTPSANLIDF